MKGWIAVVLVSFANAQQIPSDLRVQPDADNELAASLVGTWRLDDGLGKRLGAVGGAPTMQFASDPGVLVRVAPKLARELAKNRVYLAGTMRRGVKKHVFVVTEQAGNPTIVWLPAGGEKAAVDSHKWGASLVQAKHADGDMLFIKAHGNKRGARGYVRESSKSGALVLAAALEDMSRLLVTGKEKEFFKTYMSPELLATKDEQELDAMVDQVRKGHNKVLLRIVRDVAKRKPTLTRKGDYASWSIKVEGVPVDTFQMERVDGRWFIRSR